MKKQTFFLSCILLLAFVFLLPAQDSQPQESSKQKKISVDFSFGVSMTSPGAFFDRFDGTDTVMDLYTQNYGLTGTTSGSFPESKTMLPFNLTLRYALKGKLYIAGGIEYAFNNGSSNKSYTFQWPGVSNTLAYDVSYNISYFMPHVGLGYRVSPQFHLYGGVGLGFCSLGYTENVSETLSQVTVDYDCSASCTAPAFFVGAKYHLPLKKIIKGANVYFKLEFLLLNPSGFSGNRDSRSSAGGSLSMNGTLYHYNWNPYNTGGFEYWEMHDSEPSAPEYSNVEKLNVNLSGIRLMVGIRF